MSASAKDLEQVRALIALAVNASAPDPERANAAMAAAARIHKHDLLSLEAIRASRIEAEDAASIAREERARGEGAQGPSGVLVRIEVILLVMSETTGAYRFARMRPDFRTSGSPCVGWIPKKYINQTIWASSDVARTYSSAGRRVVEALIVPREVERDVRRIVLA